MDNINELREEVLSYGKGYIPDTVDTRDFVAQAAAPIEERTVSYRDQMKPIRNQGQESTCVGFSSSAVKEYYDNKQRNRSDYFSPRFIYTECKKIDGIPHEDGTYPRTAMQVLNTIGIAPEQDWPYQLGPHSQPKVATIYDDAKPQVIQAYARLNTVQDMVAQLMLSGPFLAGVWVTDGWYTDECLRTGVIDPKIRRNNRSGGHAICVMGYDADKKLFEIRNSWGDRYGDHGYNWASKDWMQKNFMDAWSLVDNTTIDAGLVVLKPSASGVMHKWIP